MTSCSGVGRAVTGGGVAEHGGRASDGRGEPTGAGEVIVVNDGFGGAILECIAELVSTGADVAKR